MSLTVSRTPDEGVERIVVAGEVDVSCADELRRALDASREAEPQAIEVDLSAVSYIDSTGIGVLVGAAHRAQEEGATFAVVSPQRNVARVLKLLGVDERLGVRP